jgi:hypothetical protein
MELIPRNARAHCNAPDHVAGQLPPCVSIQSPKLDRASHWEERHRPSTFESEREAMAAIDGLGEGSRAADPNPKANFDQSVREHCVLLINLRVELTDLLATGLLSIFGT